MKVSNLDIPSMVLIMVACILTGNYLYDSIDQLCKLKQIEDNSYYVDDMVIIRERFDWSDELINEPLLITMIHNPYIFFDVLFSDERNIKVRNGDLFISADKALAAAKELEGE